MVCVFSQQRCVCVLHFDRPNTTPDGAQTAVDLQHDTGHEMYEGESTGMSITFRSVSVDGVLRAEDRVYL